MKKKQNNQARIHQKCVMCMVFLAIETTVSAATINFLGTKSLDLSDPGNWSQETWTGDDVLVISTANATLPASGLHLTKDMPQSKTLKFSSFPNYNVEVNFGGHSLNTKTLSVDRMHDDGNHNCYLKATGGFSGVEQVSYSASFGHIRLYDGVYKVKHYLTLNNWYPYLHVCDGAELMFEDQNKDEGIKVSTDASGGQINMDGGKFVVASRSGSSDRWQRNFWGGNATRTTFAIRNGGEFRDDSTMPANEFVGENFTVKDAGYFETNSTKAVRNTLFAGSGVSFKITNSIFRVAQLYCGNYNVSDATYGNELSYNLSNGSVDFCDSEETFAFKSGSTLNTAGMIVPNTAVNNTIRFRGAKNRFVSKTFVLGGNNKVSVEGGRFAVSNSFNLISGTGCALIITNADVYLGSFNADAAAKDSDVCIGGKSNVRIGGDFSPGGEGGSLSVIGGGGGSLSVGKNRLRLTQNDQSMFFSDSLSTGSIHFAANNGYVSFGAGATNYTELGQGWTRLPPLYFADGKTNNVFVISNATYVCKGVTCKDILTTTEGPEMEAVPYTNCRGSRIEFRGDSPLLSVVNSQMSESAGEAWYSAAFGEMINESRTGWTTSPYPLKDALRLRYVLPPSTGLYKNAPLNVTSGILVLGGNAEFEFDMTNFDWPNEAVTIPLAYNTKAFTGYDGRKYIDVAQLNETNKDRLPVGPDGRTSYFALSKDGKVLNLVIRHAKRGLVLTVR